MSESDFDAITEALKGETILVQPRVSRETIVYVLKEHTDMLRDMRKDVDDMKKVAEELKKQAAENQRMMIELNYSVKDNRNDITKIFDDMSGMRGELDTIQSKLTEINDLRALIKEQRIAHDDLSSNFETFKVKTNQTHAKVVEDVELIEKKSNDTAFETKELRHIVDHFGDNLILSSTQITVESTVGFSKRPMSLFDVLKRCQRDLEDINENVKGHDNRIAENSESITTKADATVAFAVQTLDKDVLAIKNHLKQEEDQGISAIRRQCDMLTSSVESLQTNISDKIDRNVAELIVQKKYEDIVQYLQDALTATGEDEDNFKNMALELDEKLKKLASSKSDRQEIQPIQDSLVKVEASIAKLMGEYRDNSRDSNVYTKEEMEELLFEKVDKESLEEVVNEVIKNRRGKATRLASTRNIGPSSTRLIDDNGSAGGSSTGGDGGRNMMTSQSMQNLKTGSNNQREMRQQSIHTSTYGEPTIPQERSSFKDRLPKGGFPTTQPGKFRQGSEKGIPGGSKEVMQQQEMDRTGSSVYEENPSFDPSNKTTGGPYRQLAPDESYRGPPKGPPSDSSGWNHNQSGITLSTGVVPGRGLQPDGVPKGVFPPINVPGRGASVSVPPSESSGRGYIGDYHHSPHLDTDALDYIGGATKGGGFNSRSPTGVISNTNALSSSYMELQERQEQAGYMGKVPIVGQDGHFYQSDKDVVDEAAPQKSSVLNPNISNMEVTPISPTQTENSAVF